MINSTDIFYKKDINTESDLDEISAQSLFVSETPKANTNKGISYKNDLNYINNKLGDIEREILGLDFIKTHIMNIPQTGSGLKSTVSSSDTSYFTETDFYSRSQSSNFTNIGPPKNITESSYDISSYIDVTPYEYNSEYYIDRNSSTSSRSSSPTNSSDDSDEPILNVEQKRDTGEKIKNKKNVKKTKKINNRKKNINKKK